MNDAELFHAIMANRLTVEPPIADAEDEDSMQWRIMSPGMPCTRSVHLREAIRAHVRLIKSKPRPFDPRG